MIARELVDFLSEEDLLQGEEQQEAEVKGGGEKEDFTSSLNKRKVSVDEASVLFSLLSTLLMDHDRVIRETALAGVHRLFRYHALEPARIKNRYFSLEEQQDGSILPTSSPAATTPSGGESSRSLPKRSLRQPSVRGPDSDTVVIIANMSAGQAILPSVLLPSVYQATSRDGNSKHQIASVYLLPLTAYYLQIFLAELESLVDACHESAEAHRGGHRDQRGEDSHREGNKGGGGGEKGEENGVGLPVEDLLRPFQAGLQRQIEGLVDDYLRLCTDESALHMQLQAGWQLPVFIAYCSAVAVMRYTRRRKNSLKKASRISSPRDSGRNGGLKDDGEEEEAGDEGSWGAEEKKILHVLYEAVASFVRSPSVRNKVARSA